ncbi:MAG: methyltransferase, partial [Telmatospirillum sp.]|nr:methyltransferase [Telmatospirillum sp.]
AFAWPGGRALARLLLDQPDLAAGKHVFDFAAGGGIAAIAAAKAGASRVTACEIDAFALEALALNAAANGVVLEMAAGDCLEALPAADLVLAGDVFYEKPMAARVWPWLQALAARGTAVLVADPGRAYLPATGLVEIACYDVPTDRDLEDREMRRTRVLRVVALGQQVA